MLPQLLNSIALCVVVVVVPMVMVVLVAMVMVVYMSGRRALFVRGSDRVTRVGPLQEIRARKHGRVLRKGGFRHAINVAQGNSDLIRDCRTRFEFRCKDGALAVDPAELAGDRSPRCLNPVILTRPLRAL